MTKLRALIVGIQNYAEPGWAVDGPARAAQDTALCLLELADTEVTIDLYLDPGIELDPALMRECAAEGSRVNLHRSTDKTSLHRASGDALIEAADPDTHLLIYWSGHGALSNQYRERLLLCSDYSEGLPDRALYVLQWLARLRSAPFRDYKSHLMLADVCGDHMDIPVLPGAAVNEVERSAPQAVVFASLEGKSTKSQSAGGEFTQIALALLKEGGTYPDDVEQWSERLVKALKDRAYEPYQITFNARGTERGIDLRRDARTDTPDTLLDLLSTLGLDRREHFGQHYLRTIADMGLQSRRADMPSLADAIQDLADFADGSDGVSRALLQFLARVARSQDAVRADVRQRIADWLKLQPPHVQDLFEAAADELEGEDQRRILLLVMQAGDDGQIRGVEFYCCDADGRLIQSSPMQERACIGWQAFSDAAAAILKPFLPPRSALDVSVQFAVDDRFLACPFHRIDIDGEALGVLAPVVVRKTERMRERHGKEAKNARAYAMALKAAAPGSWAWKSITLDGVIGGGSSPSIAEFSVDSSQGISGVPKEMRTLSRVMRIGTALLHIPHEPPSCGQWQAVGKTLTAIAGAASNFSAFPSSFHDSRTRGDPHAEQATLIWDDPDINPFVAPRGVNDRTSE